MMSRPSPLSCANSARKDTSRSLTVLSIVTLDIDAGGGKLSVGEAASCAGGCSDSAAF
jgi:hypothetical protein